MTNFLYEVDALPSQTELQQINHALSSFQINQASVSYLEDRFSHINRQACHEWIRREGSDYLHNPKLLSNAPLSALCGLIAYITKNYTFSDHQTKFHPELISSLSSRLKIFTTH